MENITGKGLGGARKTLVLPVHAQKAQEQLGNQPANGPAGDDRGRAQEEPEGQDSWDRLVSEVKSHRSWQNTVAAAFHPDPKESMIQTVCGWVRVHQGRLGYQMNSGEMIEI